MKRIPFYKYLLYASFSIITFGCHPDHPERPNPPTPPMPPVDNTPMVSTGWSGKDNPDSVPRAINFAATFSNTNLPSKVDLSAYLPPIGNQGNKGPCVAWASAYYAKTCSEAISKNYSFNQLNSTSYQLSPEYLFNNIPDAQKGQGCDGTQFESAFRVLQQKGVATLATVPYDEVCKSSHTQQNWDQDAEKHRILSYRSIDNTVQSIKAQLANKFPVLIGARVNNAFKNWKSTEGIFKSISSGNEGHALTIVGYDDAKGAFKIVNSWGKNWGDEGFVWVDYNYLVNNFVFNKNVYTITSEESNPAPGPNPNPAPATSGVDLALWVFSDVSTYLQNGNPNARNLSFNIYNIGSQTAASSANWSVYYLYYNAYNANDYGIIFRDNFNTSIQPNTFLCSNSNSCTFNLSLAPNSSFAQAGFNTSSVNRSYLMPPLSGFYYLVLIADPEGKFADQNRQNNIFYTTSQSPKYFVQGYSNRSGKPDFSFENVQEASNNNLKKSEFNSAVTKEKWNAYSPEEIVSFIKDKIASGEIKRKIDSAAVSTGTTKCAYCN
ncbi:MAG: C1 family peptidase [Bacteroidota bacterium]|nr:C1 family peptidase [Bacteroidota bacterium]